MRRAVILVLLGGLGAILGARARGTTASAGWREGEVRRLQSHFDSVDHELSRVSMAKYPAGQRESRATLREWLRDYRDAGVFPHNIEVPYATPIFRDDQGTLCAMAYLIARSGRQDLVDAIATRENRGYIRDLAGLPGVQPWLDSVGLSVAEAARIQPAYPGDPESTGPGYVLASFATSILATSSGIVMIASPQQKTGWVGMVTGSLALALGVSQLGAEGGNRKIARWNVGVGAGTMALAAWTLRSGRRRESTTSAAPVSVTLARSEPPRVAPSMGCEMRPGPVAAPEGVLRVRSATGCAEPRP